MDFTKKELNQIQHFVIKEKINSELELLEKSPLNKEKTLKILKYLEKKHLTSNFNEIFSLFNKRIASKRTKSIKSKRELISSKYNDKLSKCW